MSLMSCPGCRKEVSRNAAACPNCGEPINTAPTCPKCGSRENKPISGMSKALSIGLWGPLAANKVLSKYECKKCFHKF